MGNPTPAQLSDDSEVAHDLRPFLVVYKDGRIHRFMGTDTVPASDSDSDTVRSKHVEISTATSARLYLPRGVRGDAKLPLLLYFHGGGFVIESAKSPSYHNYLNRLASEASAVVVSVDYRLAPEHPLPAAFEDSWEAVLWAASLSDPWLSDSADPSRVFFAGDSAGATIAHNMAVRFGKTSPSPGEMVLAGLILVHPFFMSKEPVAGDSNPAGAEERDFGVRFWKFLCSDDERGVDHPWINPAAEDGSLAAVGARKALVMVAEKDPLRDRGVWYAEVLRKSGWPGEVELTETVGEGHVFHLFSPATTPNSVQMMNRLLHFINN